MSQIVRVVNIKLWKLNEGGKNNMIQTNLDLGNIIKAEVYTNMSKKQLGEKQQMVMECLHNYIDGLTDKQIAIETGLSLSCVCGRRNELMHMGKVMPYTIYAYMGEESIMPNIVWGIK